METADDPGPAFGLASLTWKITAWVLGCCGLVYVVTVVYSNLLSRDMIVQSADAHDIPLVRRIAATGKPIIMSTGMATLAEIDEAVRTVRENGCRELVRCDSQRCRGWPWHARLRNRSDRCHGRSA